MTNLFPPGWPFKAIYVVRGWGAFGWYVWTFPNWVYTVIILAMAAVGLLALSTAVREHGALLKRVFEVLVIALFPICTLVAVEAAFFTPAAGAPWSPNRAATSSRRSPRSLRSRSAGTFGLGRRLHVPIATVLVVAMLGLSYAGQLLTLGSFFT